MPNPKDYALVGFVLGAFVSYFVTNTPLGAMVVGVAGVFIFYYSSQKHFETSDLLRKSLGAFLIYGLFVELSPTKYTIGNIPQAQLPIIAR